MMSLLLAISSQVLITLRASDTIFRFFVLLSVFPTPSKISDMTIEAKSMFVDI